MANSLINRVAPNAPLDDIITYARTTCFNPLAKKNRYDWDKLKMIYMIYWPANNVSEFINQVLGVEVDVKRSGYIKNRTNGWFKEKKDHMAQMLISVQEEMQKNAEITVAEAQEAEADSFRLARKRMHFVKDPGAILKVWEAARVMQNKPTKYEKQEVRNISVDELVAEMKKNSSNVYEMSPEEKEEADRLIRLQKQVGEMEGEKVE